MEQQVFLDKACEFFTQCTDVLSKKSPDYTSPEGEALGDIPAAADALNTTQEAIAYVHMRKHFTAIHQFIKTGRLESEGIRHRLIDLANYCAIIDAILSEKVEDEFPLVEAPAPTNFSASVMVSAEEAIVPHGQPKHICTHDCPMYSRTKKKKKPPFRAREPEGN